MYVGHTFIVCRRISFTKACCLCALPLSKTARNPDCETFWAASCAHCPAVVAPSFLNTSHCIQSTNVKDDSKSTKSLQAGAVSYSTLAQGPLLVAKLFALGSTCQRPFSFYS